jgi:excisionase family DNA binding protein
MTYEDLSVKLDAILGKLDAILTKLDTNPDSFMSAEQAAKYVGVHVETLRKWVRLGTFPRIPLPGAGKDFRFSRAVIEEWARARSLRGKRL